MKLAQTAALAPLALSCALAAPLAAQASPEPALAPLLQAFGQAGALRPSPAMRAMAAAEAAAQTAPQAASDSLFRTDDKQELPALNDEWQKYLRSRVPDLTVASVRAVPESIIADALDRASARALTFLDVLTDPIVRGDKIYFLYPETLQHVYAKYAIGLLPQSGIAKDGQAFKMVGALGGQNRITFLFDRTDDFEFDAVGRIFKVSGGRVTGVVTGPGVIDSMQGLAAQGCWGPFCKWGWFMKWQKTGTTRVHIWANAGGGLGGGVKEQDIDLEQIHRL